MTDSTRIRAILLATLALLAVATGCATTRRVAVDATPVVHAQQEIPQDQLLDVGIAPFDPGLPELDEGEPPPDDVFPEVRNAEARFIPVHLKNTLQDTGQWGVVRVIPDASASIDVLITGRIVESDGEQLRVEVEAVDATGREWFRRIYDRDAEAFFYAPRPGASDEPFQDLYNRVANDLLESRHLLTTEQVVEIRRVASLRYAADLAPDAFAGHLARDPETGALRVRRLPARGDPMMDRVGEIRERDEFVVDMLNEHYDEFYLGLKDPYRQWRAFNYEEVVALRRVKRNANIRLAAGAAAIIGGIALAMVGGGAALELVGGLLVAGGAIGVTSGITLRGDATIHSEAIRELGASFESEAAPRVVEIEGPTVRLTGSAEAQYATWRRLLREIYRAATGREPRSETGLEPASPPSRGETQADPAVQGL